MNKAFSLLELSIVLVIIGLIAGGIVAGASMIRAAEIRAIITEHEHFRTSVVAFQEKYNALPGDITNATRFWGAAHATPSTCLTSTGTGTETCNGNGDGLVDNAGNANEYGEAFAFWQHLENAGLVSGDFTGKAGSAGYQHAAAGENTPVSKVSGSTWFAIYDAPGGNSSRYDLEYGNYFTIGATTAISWPKNPIFTPAEAWNIDKKIDDGRPAYGKVIARFWNNRCAAANDGSHANDDLDADYKTEDETLRCSLYFVRAF